MGRVLPEDLEHFARQTFEDWHVPAGSIAIVVEHDSGIDAESQERLEASPATHKCYTGSFSSSLSPSKSAPAGDRESSGQPGSFQTVDEDTLSPLASLTKLFTAVAVGLLVEEGKLGWTTRIKDILPDFRMADETMGEKLTVEMALSLQSELYGHMCAGTGAQHTTSDILNIFANLKGKASRSDGQRCTSYNNHGYMVTGLVVEKLSGMPYTQFVREQILDPLGMLNSTFEQAPCSRPDRRCARAAAVTPESLASDSIGRDSGDDDPSCRHFRHLQAIDQTCRAEEDRGEAAWLPAGGLLSTASDMGKWLGLLVQPASKEDPDPDPSRQRLHRALTEVTRPRIIADWQLIFGLPALGEGAYPEFSPVHYGLGVQVFSYRGIPIACHTGSVPGTGAFLLWTPETHMEKTFGVYVNTNVMAQGLAAGVIAALRAFDLEFRLEPIDWSERVKLAEGLWRLRTPPIMPDSAERLEIAKCGDLTGFHYAPGYGALQVFRQDANVANLDEDASWLLDLIFSATKVGPATAHPDHYAWLPDEKPMWTSYFAVYHLSENVLWAEEHVLAAAANEESEAEWLDMTHATTHAPGSKGYIWIRRSENQQAGAAMTDCLDWYRDWKTGCLSFEEQLKPEHAEVRFGRLPPFERAAPALQKTQGSRRNMARARRSSIRRNR